jgi:hypothetical protein
MGDRSWWALGVFARPMKRRKFLKAAVASTAALSLPALMRGMNVLAGGSLNYGADRFSFGPSKLWRPGGHDRGAGKADLRNSITVAEPLLLDSTLWDLLGSPHCISLRIGVDRRRQL